MLLMVDYVFGPFACREGRPPTIAAAAVHGVAIPGVYIASLSCYHQLATTWSQAIKLILVLVVVFRKASVFQPR